MPIATLNGIRLDYTVTGTGGPLVVLVMGSGSPGLVWNSYQVPALVKTGFRVATFDNRGTKNVLETAREAEMSENLGYEKHDPASRGNGKLPVRHPHQYSAHRGPAGGDRGSERSFYPKIARKRQRRLTRID
ncbi:hypothetical protein A6F55_24340 [Prescottella equi]|nr:hypothetical protein A6F55_24340 [Prescottella equi]